MKFAMMEPAGWHRALVADLAVERPRLCEAMIRFRGRAAADDARL
jgi:hypothetical protein